MKFDIIINNIINITQSIFLTCKVRLRERAINARSILSFIKISHKSAIFE